MLWNENNQITSDVMDIFTENQQLTRAEFIGSPMMVSQLDTTHYNQVAGKTMTAYFFNNQIYRNDVKPLLCSICRLSTTWSNLFLNSNVT